MREKTVEKGGTEAAILAIHLKLGASDAQGIESAAADLGGGVIDAQAVDGKLACSRDDEIGEARAPRARPAHAEGGVKSRCAQRGMHLLAHKRRNHQNLAYRHQ